MFKNYFKIAFRNILKQRGFSFINIFGLAIGMACCILLFLFAQNEWQHDRYHENADKIFRLVIKESSEKGITKNTLFQADISKSVKEGVLGIERASGYVKYYSKVKYGKEQFGAGFASVDNDFLQIFSFPLLAGDINTALSQINNVVISESLAQRIFGDLKGNYSDILGKVLSANKCGEKDFIITGILKDLPQTSSLQFEVLMPLELHQCGMVSRNWAGTTLVYVQLADGVEKGVVETSLQPFLENEMAPLLEKRNARFEEHNMKNYYIFLLQPLKDIYLNRDIISHYTAHGNALNTFILAGTSFLILLIACINFMMLSLARSSGRSTEVGIRKVLGAHRWQLVYQFWGEALLLVFCALIIGFVIAELFLPEFNNLADKQLHISFFDNLASFFVLLAILLITGILAGSYPALVLSRFQPVRILKEQTTIGGHNRFTRFLVIIQFTILISFIVCIGVMYQQLNYMLGKDLGYDKEHVVVVSVPGEQIAERFKAETVKYARVISASGSDRSFTSGSQSRGIKNDIGEYVTARIIRVDDEYINTLDIHLLKGRNFSKMFASDTTNSLIVNETLVKKMGWINPIGKLVEDLQIGKDGPPPRIVGVVKDFHIDKLRNEIQPLIMSMDSRYHGIYYVFVRIQEYNISGTIEQLRESWQTVIPNVPFNFSFLDEKLGKQYKAEKRWLKIIGYSTVFTIFISCLGLIGLVSLTISKRTKEIGVRKVLGASVSNIISLLSKEFSKRVLYANLIAWPIAWLIMNKWLQDFAYRIELSWWIFLIAGLLALIIALLTVSWQAIKAALANPVDSLRNE